MPLFGTQKEGLVYITVFLRLSDQHRLYLPVGIFLFGSSTMGKSRFLLGFGIFTYGDADDHSKRYQYKIQKMAADFLIRAFGHRVSHCRKSGNTADLL